jgi:hypothetical protein
MDSDTDIDMDRNRDMDRWTGTGSWTSGMKGNRPILIFEITS